MREAESMWVHFVSIALPIIFTMIGTVALAAWGISKKIGSFTTLFREFRLHMHTEEEGALKVSGVKYPRSLNGD